MSALGVRKLSRAWARQVSPVDAPFYDTVNTETNPTDDVWWTIEFFTSTHNGETFCRGGYIEGGQLDLVFCGRAGIGDEALLTAAEAVVAAFTQKIDPDARLVLENYEPIAEVLGGDADLWYRIACTVNYTWRAT
jgi:hypothetical protein